MKLQVGDTAEDPGATPEDHKFSYEYLNSCSDVEEIEMEGGDGKSQRVR